jgi:hypothetical protein
MHEVRRAKVVFGAVAALLVTACSVFRNQGPVVPNWDTADQAGNSTENQRGVFAAVAIGVCIGDPIDGSPDEGGVWHYHATNGPCPDGGAVSP